jgi:cytolysin (calcineurin-like family phosphatase)
MTFANEVYLGLENKDSQMKSSIGFNGVVDSIEDLNRKSTGNRIVSIPEMFKTKKDIVDSFIEDL